MKALGFLMVLSMVSVVTSAELETAIWCSLDKGQDESVTTGEIVGRCSVLQVEDKDVRWELCGPKQDCNKTKPVDEGTFVIDTNDSVGSIVKIQAYAWTGTSLQRPKSELCWDGDTVVMREGKAIFLITEGGSLPADGYDGACFPDG